MLHFKRVRNPTKGIEKLLLRSISEDRRNADEQAWDKQADQNQAARAAMRCTVLPNERRAERYRRRS